MHFLFCQKRILNVFLLSLQSIFRYWSKKKNTMNHLCPPPLPRARTLAYKHSCLHPMVRVPGNTHRGSVLRQQDIKRNLRVWDLVGDRVTGVKARLKTHRLLPNLATRGQE
ncbi:hypothetical protein DNTS_025995 [Danionella cerebrum]|uniref:Uncharacterized protein n=1 Tax=Danionella cerebrum TaxID=2873325 RepID=A0A553PVG4_9TELE|nr:hypothetical protein DNTS_025995 [Danionella translucida]